MNTPSITVTPSQPTVGLDATAEATWTTPPVGPVTIIITDLTTEPPTVIASRSFSADPYKLTFNPDNAGAHLVTVTWRNGEDSTSQGFNVQT